MNRSCRPEHPECCATGENNEPRRRNEDTSSSHQNDTPENEKWNGVRNQVPESGMEKRGSHNSTDTSHGSGDNPELIESTKEKEIDNLENPRESDKTREQAHMISHRSHEVAATAMGWKWREGPHQFLT